MCEAKKDGAPQPWERGCLAAVLAAGLLAAGGCGSPQKPAPEWVGADCVDPGQLWFDDLGAGLGLSAEEAGVTLRAAYRVLAGDAFESEHLPARLRADREPRIVFAWASDGHARAGFAIGAAAGFARALEVALAKLGPAPGGSSFRWLRLDIVETAQRIDARSSEDLPGELEEIGRRGQGVASPRAFRHVESPGAPARGCYPDCDWGAVLKRARACEQKQPEHSASGGRVAAGSNEVGPWRFTAASYFYDGDSLLELYRGHRVRPAPSAEALLASARAGGGYLRRVTGADGAFVYNYRASRDAAGDDYNMVRHAGTVYSMLELWEVTREPALLEAAERAISYLMRYVVPYGERADRASVLAYRGKIKLGGVGLTLLALAKHMHATGKREHLDAAQRLGRYIALSQHGSGEFVHSRVYPGGKERPFKSRYYPGEALFALARLHDIDGDDVWLDVAERGARFLIEVRDKGVATAQLDHDHWLLYALNELYRKRERPEFLHHAMRIAQAISGAQHRSPELRDHLGTYNDPPRSAPVATRTEGLAAAHALARDFGQPEMVRAIRKTVELNVGFQLLTQVGPERALLLPAPQRALGGFTHGLTDFRIRIDYVQHNISALLGAYRMLRDQE